MVWAVTGTCGFDFMYAHGMDGAEQSAWARGRWSRPRRAMHARRRYDGRMNEEGGLFA